MKTHVEFRSEKFPPYDGEEDEINPGRWGKRLAEFIAEGLSREGVQAGEIYAEDWGWVVPVANDNYKLWIGCGNQEDYPDGFLCFIEPSNPVIRKLFKKVDATSKVTRVSEALGKVLSADPTIRDIRWCTAEEFNK